MRPSRRNIGYIMPNELRRRIKDAKEMYELYHYGAQTMNLTGDIFADWNQKAQEYYAEYVSLQDQLKKQLSNND
jgi:hypothetical protein